MHEMQTRWLLDNGAPRPLGQNVNVWQISTSELKWTLASWLRTKGWALDTAQGIDRDSGSEKDSHSFNEMGNRNLCSSATLFPFRLGCGEPTGASEACVGVLRFGAIHLGLSSKPRGPTRNKVLEAH